jgi:hypothetical protein
MNRFEKETKKMKEITEDFFKFLSGQNLTMFETANVVKFLYEIGQIMKGNNMKKETEKLIEEIDPTPDKFIGLAARLDIKDYYDSLRRELQSALHQASEGKGKERHADDEPFEDQKICTITRWLRDSPVAGALFQAVKKCLESARLDPVAAIHELDGATVYIQAAKIELRKIMNEPNVKPKREVVCEVTKEPPAISTCKFYVKPNAVTRGRHGCNDPANPTHFCKGICLSYRHISPVTASEVAAAETHEEFINQHYDEDGTHEESERLSRYEGGICAATNELCKHHIVDEVDGIYCEHPDNKSGKTDSVHCPHCTDSA